MGQKVPFPIPVFNLWSFIIIMHVLLIIMGKVIPYMGVLPWKHWGAIFLLFEECLA
jgi:hypothetical protein